MIGAVFLQDRTYILHINFAIDPVILMLGCNSNLLLLTYKLFACKNYTPP